MAEEEGWKEEQQGDLPEHLQWIASGHTYNEHKQSTEHATGNETRTAIQWTQTGHAPGSIYTVEKSADPFGPGEWRTHGVPLLAGATMKGSVRKDTYEKTLKVRSMNTATGEKKGTWVQPQSFSPTQTPPSSDSPVPKAPMDSFTTISFTSKAPATDIPADNEDTGSGQGSGGYCVVFSRDVPTDEEDTGSGQGSGGYCTIA
ncbi:hypothetical protein DFP72DRAFT_1143128 [Ephemerocybe angulata]|uniref:Uncharacterized protein n=1 Tax=Ephemerocybe angulata TaxID=980116 RepID=A0A8H6HN04_9AGAR|nr:hypothetical protein DFP72DRAFT_1143128 [Tulosesus angulatus]